MNYVEHFDLYRVKAKQIPCITGEGVPTTETEGAIGCLYMDTLTGELYKCTAIADGVYTWKPIIDDESAELPTVTENDNEKILQVVDGEYVLIAVEDSSVKTYIDNYINEALGGEY